MSETPRTDAFFYERNREPSSKFMLKLARTLERELAAVTKERDVLLAAIQQQWELLPLLPTAPPGSYARGFDSGMRNTLTAIRAASSQARVINDRCGE